MAKNTANPLNWDFGITGVDRYLNAPYNGSLQIPTDTRTHCSLKTKLITAN